MTRHGTGRTVRRIIRTLGDGPGFEPALAAFLAAAGPGDRPMVLDSSRPDSRWGRFSYLAIDPVWLLVAEGGEPPRIRALGAATIPGYSADSERDGGGGARPCGPAAKRGDGGAGGYSLHSHLASIREALDLVRLDERDRVADGENRFVGGWAGYLGYEFGATLEGVPPAPLNDLPLPRMQWAFYDALACCDHLAGRWELSALVMDDEPAARARLDMLEALIRGGPHPHPNPLSARETGQSDDGREPDDWIRSAGCNFTRSDYERAVRRAKDYIAAGDIYQVNISQRFRWPTRPDAAGPARLFARLRRRHPAWYSAFLLWHEQANAAAGVRAICSASPELFLSLTGRRVTTRPIKGTVRRGTDPDADRSAVAALAASAKDAAELAMIVDLERNDLGRVCRYGTVRVTEPRAVESHAHVHHTVATIEGELADGRDLADLLAATFPGGSITGAPKIRSMQIIAELEPTARSAYTGAIGYAGADGSAMFNIAIRTVLLADRRAHLQVGGGIVADSDPAAEYAETLAKAQGLAQAIC